MGLEEGHEKDQRAGAPLLWKQPRTAGAVQAGDGKAPGRCFQYLKGAY